MILVCFLELSLCQIINANFECNVGDTSCNDLLELPILEPEPNSELKPELKPGINSRPLASKSEEAVSNGMLHKKHLYLKMQNRTLELLIHVKIKSCNRNNPYIKKWGSMYYIGVPTFRYTDYFCYLTLAVRIFRTVRSTRCSFKLSEIFAKSKVFGLFSVCTVRRVRSKVNGPKWSKREQLTWKHNLE